MKKKTLVNPGEPTAARPEPSEAWPSVVETTVLPDAESAAPFSYDAIARRAYEIYLERGGAPGDPLDDWLRAERELSNKS